MSNGGYGNIILPGVFGNPGEALDQSIALKERRDERSAALQQRQYEEQQRQRQQDDYRKANLLDKQANDIVKYHTGEQEFDGWVDNKAKEILDKYTNDPTYRNMDIATFEGNLNRDWLPIIQGYGAVKGKMQQELASVNDIASQQKWVNKDALTNKVYDMIAKEYMQPDEKGGFVFKPLDRVDHSRSFTGEILNSPDSYKLVNDAAIDDFTKNISEAKGESRNYLLHNPDGSVSHFKGNLSPFESENIKPDDKGFVKQAPSYGIVTEGRTDASGNPINTLPEDVIKNYMANTTGRQKAMQKLFFDHAEQMGVDVSKLTTKQLSDEMQKFAYTAVKGTRNNQPDLFAYNQPPKGTTVNVGNTKNAGSDWVKSVATAVQSLDNDAVNNLMSDLEAGNGAEKYLDHFIKDGLLYIQTMPKKGEDGADPQPLTTKIAINDPHLESKIRSIYQRVNGGDAPVEKASYKQAKPQPNQSTGKKKITGF